MILKAPTQQDIIIDIQTVLPEFEGGRYSIRFNTNREIIAEDSENTQSPSGWRADVVPLGNEILEPPEYDKDGNQTKEAVTGEYRYDVRLPDWMNFESDFEVVDPEKEPLKAIRKELREENKRLKAENKALRDRIADADDYADLKGKLTKVKDSEDAPTKWGDKVPLLRGEHTYFKDITDVYLVKEDHTADKDAEPQDTPELYERI